MKSKKQIKKLINYILHQLKTNENFWNSEEYIQLEKEQIEWFIKNKIYEKYFKDFDDWVGYSCTVKYCAEGLNLALLEMLKGKFKFPQDVVDSVAIDAMEQLNEKYGIEDEDISLEEYVQENWDVLSKEERERCFNICDVQEEKKRDFKRYKR